MFFQQFLFFAGLVNPLCDIETTAAPSTTPPLECDSQLCHNGGTCIPEPSGGGRCECTEGFYGFTCSLSLLNNPCTEMCLDGINCFHSDPHFSCSCPAECGSTDITTSTVTTPTLTPCSSAPCRNQGICVDEPSGGFTCTCTVGVYGVTCDIIASSMACDSALCGEGADCHHSADATLSCDCPDNTTDDCVCSQGFYGKGCLLVPLSLLCEPDPCRVTEKCSHGAQTDLACNCPDVRSCRQSTPATETTPDATTPHITTLTSPCTPNPCMNSDSCVPLNADDFQCLCVTGFYGRLCDLSASDVTCTQCQQSLTCHHDSDVDIICICDTPRACGCGAGQYGEECSLVPLVVSCQACDGDMCHHHQQSDINCTCSQSLCNTTSPVITTTPTTTTSPTDTQTTQRSPCLQNLCRNGATCVPGGTDEYKCICIEGFYGKLCELVTSQLLCEGCPVAGLCYYATSADYICDCTSSERPCTVTVVSTSTQATTTTGPCAPSPCENGATCVPAGNEAICFCTFGYFGSLCSLTDTSVSCDNVCVDSCSHSSLSDIGCECDRTTNTPCGCNTDLLNNFTYYIIYCSLVVSL